MIVKQYMELTTPEMYVIWWHMGFTDTSDTLTLGQAIDQYPIVWAMHTADMMASHFMEDTADNKPAFISETVYAEPPLSEDEDESSEFQEAMPYETGQ